MNIGRVLARVQSVVTSGRAKAMYTSLLAAITIAVVLALSLVYNGLIDTIIYGFLFVLCLTIFPTTITLFGNATPLGEMVAKLHIILGAIAFNHHYLVQLENELQWCPGDKDRVYVDGEWHSIDEGENNLSILGWRPFGLLRYKDKDTYTEYRVDTKAERERGATDGGSVTRAGIREAKPPAISGIDGEWVIDLKRVFGRGLKKIGDVELIETAEEIIERGQVDTTRMGSYRPLVETLAGIVFGVITGYIYLFIS